MIPKDPCRVSAQGGCLRPGVAGGARRSGSLVGISTYPVPTVDRFQQRILALLPSFRLNKSRILRFWPHRGAHAGQVAGPRLVLTRKRGKRYVSSTIRTNVRFTRT